MDLRLKNYSSPLESLDLGKSLNCCPNKVCDDTCTDEQALKYECASDWPVYPIVGGTLGATGLDVHNCMSQLQVTFSEKGHPNFTFYILKSLVSPIRFIKKH